MSEPLRILHVSQASSGGVLNALVQLANSQAAQGANIYILFGRRPDTPTLEELRALFSPDITLAEAPGRGMGVRAMVGLYLQMIKLMWKVQPSYVHLHSSFAGAVGRIAALSIGRQSSTFYSPHGFSFLRQDVTAWKRRLFAFVESALHSIGSSMVLVSASERNAALRHLSSKRLFVLENGIDTNKLPIRQKRTQRPLVGTAGRITYAKAPWKFSLLAQSLAASADFQWIGGGGTTESNEWLSSTSVEITGWLSEDAALRRIAALDIYVSTSLWEGLPIAVLQAQALGIPCVVSNCIGNIDIIDHGVTGYIADNEQSLRDYVRDLVRDEPLRRRLGESASKMAVKRFDSSRLGPESFRIYRHAEVSG